MWVTTFPECALAGLTKLSANARCSLGKGAVPTGLAHCAPEYRGVSSKPKAAKLPLVRALNGTYVIVHGGKQVLAALQASR